VIVCMKNLLLDHQLERFIYRTSRQQTIIYTSSHFCLSVKATG